MSDNKVEGFMKKNPPWFMFDIHPIRHAKKVSEQEEKVEKEMNEEMDARRLQKQAAKCASLIDLPKLVFLGSV
jgi:hypothetical protein